MSPLNSIVAQMMRNTGKALELYFQQRAHEARPSRLNDDQVRSPSEREDK